MLIRKEFAEDGVLIELYWNVNGKGIEKLDDVLWVLIELYWNVNEREDIQRQLKEASINRTILECKCE